MLRLRKMEVEDKIDYYRCLKYPLEWKGVVEGKTKSVLSPSQGTAT